MVGADPQRQLDDALRRFKQIETGEIIRSEASPDGTDAKQQHPVSVPRSRVRPISRSRRNSMRANCWMGRNTVQVRDVPDPTILNRRDAIIKVTSTAICGSDLHLYDGYIPTMEKGDILGHEFMGTVVEVGSGVTNLSVGDRVVVLFPIACGACNSCGAGLFALCENSNPNAGMAEKLGSRQRGIFGYSHLTGGFAGGQAEYVRVPFADVGPIKIENDLPDEKVLFLSDIFRPPTWAPKCVTSGPAT